MADQEDGNKEPDRGLDNAPTSSMDIQSLNNVVVSLRGLMKRVQLFTIQKLVRQSKQLRSKKGTVENQKKQKKAERLVQEVGSVKDVKIDHAIKYALGNTKTFEEVAGKGDLDTRAKVRLATHPLMVEKVKCWRDQHEDWKALAAFVLYKNTGRRYKKKKKKDKDDKSAEESTSTEKPAKLSKTTKSKSKEEEGKESTPSKRKLVVQKIGDGESAKELARRAKTARNRQNHGETEKVADDDTSKSTDPSKAAVPPTVTRAESSKNDAKREEDNSSVSSKEDNSSMETEEKVDDEEDDSSMETKEKVDDEADDSSEEDEVSETEHRQEDVKSDTKEEHREEAVKSDTKDADDSENESSAEESGNEESDEDEEDTKIETKSTKQTEASSKEVTKPVKLKLKPKIETNSTKQTEASSKEVTKPVKLKLKPKIETNSTKQTEASSKEVTAPVKLKPKPKPIGYKAGKDMAIKKIDLTSLSEDVEDIPVEADVSFLFTASKADDIPKPKPKKKDAFFAMDSGEEEDEDSKEETTKDRRERKEKINYDNDVGMQRKLHHKKLESAFVGRLSDKQAKGDWGYGKGSFSRPPPEEQGPCRRGRGGVSSSGGDSRGRAGVNQGVQRDQRAGQGGGGGDFSGSTGARGPQTQRDQPANAMDHGAQDGKLHPSWEAKRKRKELESKITEFKGKKIKFDD